MFAFAPARAGHVARIVVLLGLVVALGACGNKGDLFLEGEADRSVDEPSSPFLTDDATSSSDQELLDLLDKEDEERELLRRETAEELDQQ